MTHSPTHEALKSMREWMALFIHATKLDPAKTSITFRGPGRHMPLNVKLQEILDLADKALFAEEYPLVELNAPANYREPGEFGEGATVRPTPQSYTIKDLRNAIADRVDEQWRAKGGLNCTEVCAIIRGWRL